MFDSHMFEKKNGYSIDYKIQKGSTRLDATLPRATTCLTRSRVLHKAYLLVISQTDRQARTRSINTCLAFTNNKCVK